MQSITLSGTGLELVPLEVNIQPVSPEMSCYLVSVHVIKSQATSWPDRDLPGEAIEVEELVGVAVDAGVAKHGGRVSVRRHHEQGWNYQTCRELELPIKLEKIAEQQLAGGE